MAMPWQLARANRRRSHSEPRPTVEFMPAICIDDLRQAIPRNYGTNIYSNPFRYPQVRHMRLSYRSIEIIDHDARSQIFGIQWIPTYFGKHRAVFVCSSCRGGAIRLFGKDGNYACIERSICRKNKRPLVANASQACKLRLELGGWPDIHDLMPSRPKWTRRRTYQRIRHQSKPSKHKPSEHASAKKLRTFSYHVASSKI
ncbi:MAG: hypothetical protein E6G76_15425 [Alphaproteobacteria bacterium]|jgi:hypothetical protein|nr:MAG: hypothetical protein E6G76_15425 [Alphaproteobacteria bacterium]